MGLIQLLKKVKQSRRQAKVFILGLPGAGKSSIYEAWTKVGSKSVKKGDSFEIANLQVSQTFLEVWDFKGSAILQYPTIQFFDSADAIVWVVSTASAESLSQSVSVFSSISSNDRSRPPVLAVISLNSKNVRNQLVEAFAGSLGNFQFIEFFETSTSSPESMQNPLNWVIETLQAHVLGQM